MTTLPGDGERGADPLLDWLLTAEERDNPYTRLAEHTDGNSATPLVHGATYFARLAEAVDRLDEGDLLLFTDWRGDHDERLAEDGRSVGEVLGDAARRGVEVRGLVWRSHADSLRLQREQNQALDAVVEAAGGHVILDQRVHRFGSHHQKLVVCRSRTDPSRDVAFVGGIDLCHGRRDDADHEGDPQTLRMAPEYGDTPAWHDVQLELRGPVVGEVETVFRERWQDSTHPDSHNPLARLRDTWKGARLRPTVLPAATGHPDRAGRHTVQLLRTYPVIQPAYDFAPSGEFTVARGYTKALRRAQRLVYVEDQYLWSRHVADLLAGALRDQPDLHLVVVVPAVPDQEAALAVAPNRVGQRQALSVCQEVAGDRVHVFHLENPRGVPVYVHAKVCVVDDAWATVGSDNLNRRSWTHDSELTAVVADPERDRREPADPRGDGLGARRFPRDLRLRLAAEHLDRDPDDPDALADLLDPAAFVDAFDAAADRLDAWHAGGCVGPRPPGRLRRHLPPPVPWRTRVWAAPVYRWLHDPDGRTVAQRRRDR